MLTSVESGINGVMSWFLISALLSRDNGEEEVRVCDPHADPNQACDGNSYDQQLNIVLEYPPQTHQKHKKVYSFMRII